MFFGFQLTLGLMMAFYGFSVMKNPRAVRLAVHFWLGLCLLPPYPLVQAERGLLMAVAPCPEREKAH